MQRQDFWYNPDAQSAGAIPTGCRAGQFLFLSAQIPVDLETGALVRYPWDLLTWNTELLKDDSTFFPLGSIDETANCASSAEFVERDRIHIAAGVRIGAGAIIDAIKYRKERLLEVAKAVVEACKKPSDFKFLYDVNASIKDKIHAIATKIYNADGVSYEATAEKQIAAYEKAGFDKLPMCMAKTHLSISHDPLVKGAPSGFTMPVREVRASVGAGFIYPLIGSMSTMPGLATYPAYMKIDLDPDTGEIKGLS